jgi:stage V sporulation protein G
MQVTEVKIRKLTKDKGRLLAIVSVTFDGEFALHDIKIVQGDGRLFVAMILVTQAPVHY